VADLILVSQHKEMHLPRKASSLKETRFTRDYGVRHPIALAPMAFVGTVPDLKEQAAQIQKVSAQLEVSKPAPQVVNNP
jgi:hypothetical protein